MTQSRKWPIYGKRSQNPRQSIVMAERLPIINVNTQVKYKIYDWNKKSLAEPWTLTKKAN